jgi:hypothetical protein
MKTCYTCKEELPLSAFSKDKKAKDCLNYACRTCWSKRSAENRSKDPDRYRVLQRQSYEKNKHKYKERGRDYHLKTTYGISSVEYEKMLEAQAGICNICDNPATEELYNILMVDHCHKTNKVRGLLCRQCNIGLGAFKDNVETMLKAINYLRT